MKITCPSCETSYEVNSGAMPDGGRKVRCARCGHLWHATPEESAPEPAPQAAEEIPAEPQAEVAEAAPEVPAEEPDGGGGAVPAKADETDAGAPERQEDATLVAAEMVEDPGDEDEPSPRPRPRNSASPEAAAARAAQHIRIRRAQSPSATRTLYGFAIGATLAMAVLGVQYREDVVRAMPQSAAIYRALGMQVNIRGLRFESLVPQRTVEDGVPTLVVEGKILNIRNAETEVPALNFVLRNASGDELYRWTIEPLQQVLHTGGELPFRTRLASPPADADAVELRFVDRATQRVGMRP